MCTLVRILVSTRVAQENPTDPGNPAEGGDYEVNANGSHESSEEFFIDTLLHH
jgi:hypothetical protein